MDKSLFNEDDITAVVRAFYARVREDDMLAPIFATRIKGQAWRAHEDHIISFWSSIFLQNQRFSGNPMRKHMALSGLTPEHFARWLTLFQDTAQKRLTPEKADMMDKMARRIAQSFQMGLAVNFEKSGQADHPFKAFALRPPD